MLGEREALEEEEGLNDRLGLELGEREAEGEPVTSLKVATPFIVFTAIPTVKVAA